MTLPAEIKVWRSTDTLEHIGTWTTTRYPPEAVTYVRKADAQAAVALVVEQAADFVGNEAPSFPDEVAWCVEDLATAIRALAPADGLAAVEALRAERDTWREGSRVLAAQVTELRDTLAAELAAAKEREAGDTDLLLNAYKAMLVLHRICDKSGLTAGADAANNIADQIVAAHPEMPGRASLRAALASRPDGGATND